MTFGYFPEHPSGFCINAPINAFDAYQPEWLQRIISPWLDNIPHRSFPYYRIAKPAFRTLRD